MGLVGEKNNTGPALQRPLTKTTIAHAFDFFSREVGRQAERRETQRNQTAPPTS